MPFVSVEATDQDHVARLGEARDGEQPPVARPIKGTNLVSLETGQLKGQTPVERRHHRLRSELDSLSQPVRHGAS